MRPGAFLDCAGACRCAAALGQRSILGPLLAPVEASGSSESIHGIVHKLHAEQNRNATFSAGNAVGATVDSGDIFEVQCLCASGGWVTRDGKPSDGAVATPSRVHHARPNGSLRHPAGEAKEAEYKASVGLVSGNPICEPIYVKGAEPGDTLQVDVLDLRTAEFGWTCVRPAGTLLGHPTREFLGPDPVYDDPDAPELGADAPRVFIWDLHPDTKADCELALADGRVLKVPYARKSMREW